MISLQKSLNMSTKVESKQPRVCHIAKSLTTHAISDLNSLNLVVIIDYWILCRFADSLCRLLQSNVKGWAQNRGLFDCRFKIVRIVRFWQFQRHWTRKICGIA